MMLSGDTGCRAIFGDHLEGIVRLPVEDVGILLDIDQRGDMEALRRAADRAERRTAVLEINLGGPKAADAARRAPELVIVGRGPLAIALANLAHVLRFTVTLVDPLLAIDEVPEADRVLHALEFSILPANPERYIVLRFGGDRHTAPSLLLAEPFSAIERTREKMNEWTDKAMEQRIGA
jgi:hypothetical protein